MSESNSTMANRKDVEEGIVADGSQSQDEDINAPSKADNGRVPVDVSTAARGDNSSKRISTEGLLAALDSDGSGQIDIKKFAAPVIMKADDVSKNTSPALAIDASGEVSTLARYYSSPRDIQDESELGSSNICGLEDDPELGHVFISPWNKSLPFYADGSSIVNVTPPSSCSYDTQSPYSYNVDADARNYDYADSSWAKSSLLVADDPTIQNSMAESGAGLSSTGPSRRLQHDHDHSHLKSPFPYSFDVTFGNEAKSSFNDPSLLFLDDLAPRNIATELDARLPSIRSLPDQQHGHGRLKSPFPYSFDATATTAGNHTNSPFAESSPLFSDDLAAQNITAELDAKLPSTGPQPGLNHGEDHLKSPFPYSFDTTVGIELNSSFDESSPLFADNMATPNNAAEFPLARPNGLVEADHDDATSLSPGATIGFTTDSGMKVSTMRGVVEDIHSSDDSPPAPAVAENEFGGISVTRKMRGELPEQIHDQAGPDPFAIPGIYGGANIKEKIHTQAASDAQNNSMAATPKEVNELSPPVPFNYSQFEDQKVKKHQGDDESISIPTPDEAETGVVPLSVTRTLADIRHRNILGYQGSPRMRMNAHSDARTPSNAHLNRSDMGASNPNPDANGPLSNTDMDTGIASANTDTTPIPERDESLPKIPVAFLVEDSDIGEVIIATHVKPQRPLWRRKRVVCFFVSMILGVTAIVAGVMSFFAGKQETLVIAIPTSPPTTSDMPTSLHSNLPSTSPAPSSSPSACALKITENTEMLKMPVDHPVDTQVAIDGTNAVVVTRERDTKIIHIIFYMLEEKEWEIGNVFIHNGVVGPNFSVALSGTAAFVGFPHTVSYKVNRHGVYVYSQSRLGEWEFAEWLYPLDEGFFMLLGSSVDIDEDLACVWYRGPSPRVYIFQKTKKKWVQIQRFDVSNISKAEKCFIDGDTIVVQIDSHRIDIYKYDHDLESYKEIQEPFRSDDEISSMSFSQDALVYSTRSLSGACYVTDIFVYRQQDMNGTYTLEQNINSTNHGECDTVGFDPVVSYDKDLLVAGRVNGSDFFVLDNAGNWESSLILDKSYRNYQISGRNLLTISFNDVTKEDEVYYMNIESCATTPTQIPSLSIAPSSTAPTFAPITEWPTYTRWYTLRPTESTAPTFGPTKAAPSINPSLSAPPTTTIAPSSSPSVSMVPTETCYWVDITIVFDSFPWETSWEIQQINAVGDNVILKAFNVGAWVDQSKLYKDSMCLEGGQYRFTIYDSVGDGLFSFCGDGYYNVTSYGELITQGSLFEFNETTKFPIPLTSNPSAMPSLSLYPSSSSFPSLSPSSSILPTITSLPSSPPTTSRPDTPFPTWPSSLPPTVPCLWIDIQVSFDEHPSENSWQLVNANNATKVAPSDIIASSFSYTAAFANKRFEQHLCLPDGVYEFTIYDRVGDGMCCDFGSGNYSLVSYGETATNLTIATGGVFAYQDTAMFSVPFVA